jgi:hypothetical protein
MRGQLTLDPRLDGTLAKLKFLVRVLRLLDRQQLCLAGACLIRARIAVRVRSRTREVETPLCTTHARQLTERPRGGLRLLRGWRFVGQRALKSGEILPGPLTEDDA